MLWITVDIGGFYVGKELWVENESTEGFKVR